MSGGKREREEQAEGKMKRVLGTFRRLCGSVMFLE